jgi:hypothetical protein
MNWKAFYWQAVANFFIVIATLPIATALMNVHITLIFLLGSLLPFVVAFYLIVWFIYVAAQLSKGTES